MKFLPAHHLTKKFGPNELHSADEVNMLMRIEFKSHLSGVSHDEFWTS